MSVVLALGKLAVVKMLVEPVMIGSFVITPNPMVGMIWVSFIDVVHELICVKLPPKFSRCALIEYVRFALPCLRGVLRRVWPVVRYGHVTNVVPAVQVLLLKIGA